MVNPAARRYWVHLFVPAGFVIGWYLDKLQDQKLTAFRNKSALFGRWEKNSNPLFIKSSMMINNLLSLQGAEAWRGGDLEVEE